MRVDTQNPHAQIGSGIDAIPRSEKILGGKLKLALDNVARFVDENHGGPCFLFDKLAGLFDGFFLAETRNARFGLPVFDH